MVSKVKALRGIEPALKNCPLPLKLCVGETLSAPMLKLILLKSAVSAHTSKNTVGTPKAEEGFSLNQVIEVSVTSVCK